MDGESTYSYPPFPNASNGLGGFLIALIEWVIEVPAIAIANFFIGLEGSAQSGADASATSVTGFIGATWQQSIASFAQFGIIAPILAAAIWGFALVILIFFVFKAIQLVIRETEDN